MLKNFGLVFALFCLLTYSSLSSSIKAKDTTSSPGSSSTNYSTYYDTLNETIIGIITQSTNFVPYDPNSYDYIAASYVKWIEQSGAQVVAIDWTLPFSVMDELLNNLNGVLFPGGSMDVNTNPNSEWQKTVSHIVSYAMGQNDNGKYFPLWGTCLGYEAFMIAINGNNSIITGGMDGLNKSVAIQVPNRLASKLYSNMSESLVQYLEENPALFFDHTYGVLNSTFYKTPNLYNNLNAVATSLLPDGTPIIASVEHKKYPFYASQYHFEKNQFEWRQEYCIPHGINSILAAQIGSLVFVNEARLSEAQFPDMNTLDTNLIYNYPPLKTAAIYDTVYLFVKRYPQCHSQIKNS